jgi:hypothetical protein
MANIYANIAPSQLSLLNRIGYNIRIMCILLWYYTSTNCLYNPRGLNLVTVVSRLHNNADHILLFGYMGGICRGLGSIYPFNCVSWKHGDSIGVD